MKIAFLNFYGGKHNRGVETVVYELGSRLAKNHNVTVFQSASHLSDTKYEVIPIETHSNWSRPFEKYALGWRFFVDYWNRQVAVFTLQALRKLSCDTQVVFAMNGGWQTLLCRLWSWWYGQKLIVPGGAGPGWDDRVNLLCRPDLFIAFTESQTKWAQRNSFGTPVSTIPNGIDTSLFRRKKDKIDLKLPKPVILCPAALESDKNIGPLIEAVARLREGSLLILGNGSGKTEFTNLGQKLLPGRFNILTVPYKTMPDYYNSCQAVVMAPSSAEAFGVVVLEAMACGKYVVTTDDPVRREIAGPAGIFIDPTDVSKLTEAISLALSKPISTDFGEHLAKFSWESITKQYEDALEKIVIQKSS